MIKHHLLLGAAIAAITAATPATAQVAGPGATNADPAQEAGAEDSGRESEIVVTGSRIAREGFDQPTPTTVIGEVELRQGARPNIAQVLADQPAVSAGASPQGSNGNTATGTATINLRNIGAARSLRLIESRRSLITENLNNVPTALIERLEIVTGGASAAWGSDAVSGVVNIILRDDFSGLAVGANSGISSRGDGFRYGVDVTYGMNFAGGRGNFVISGEYVDDKGLPDRNSRDSFGSAGIVRVNPTSTTDLSTVLVRDVNYGNQAAGGLITTGILAGQVFNSDGTLRPFRTGQRVGTAAFPAQVIGGEDAIGLYDDIALSTPFDRGSVFARARYDLGGAEIWIDGAYGYSGSDSPFLPDFGIAPLTIQATNPFLSQTIRNQLAAAGQTSFTLGRVFNDSYFLQLDQSRNVYEGAVGIDGSFGGGRFKYSAYYTHAQSDVRTRINNSRLAARFNNAINAVSSNGQIVCAINADAVTANDDPACRPINPFGSGNVSPEALAYTTAAQSFNSREKLDAASAEIQADLFSLWAEPITVLVGVEGRWQELRAERGALDATAPFGSLSLFAPAPAQGDINVKEVFGEVLLPLIDVENTLNIDLNGAARYSDYNLSGGVTTWKGGATVRLFNDLLLRATRSRDIRAANFTELFTQQALNVGPLVDRDSAGRAAANPLYNANPSQVRTLTGGNVNLQPEIGDTLVIGGSYSPSFFRGFSLSVDYYDIKLEGFITTLSGQNLTLACSTGSQEACARVTRDATGTVTEVRANFQNIARLETRGVDFEATYLTRLSAINENWGGTLRLRALATYVDALINDNGVTRTDTARSLPRWRATFSATYQGEQIGLDARVRYFDRNFYQTAPLLPVQPITLINNEIAARAYLDLGAQFKVNDRFTFTANVNNVLDVKSPIIDTQNSLYDAVGTYFTFGGRVRF